VCNRRFSVCEIHMISHVLVMFSVLPFFFYSSVVFCLNKARPEGKAFYINSLLGLLPAALS